MVQSIKYISDTIGVIGFDVGFRVGEVELERRKSETCQPKEGRGGKVRFV